MASQPKTETLATVSLVLGILGIVLSCCWIGVALGLGGVITGFLARQKIKQSAGMLTGEGLALGGIITGASSIVFVIGLSILVFVLDFSF